MTERKIERWLRQRAMTGKPSQLDKFAETGWRWVYYTGIFTWGIKCLWSKKWLWTIKVIQSGIFIQINTPFGRFDYN